MARQKYIFVDGRKVLVGRTPSPKKGNIKRRGSRSQGFFRGLLANFTLSDEDKEKLARGERLE